MNQDCFHGNHIYPDNSLIKKKMFLSEYYYGSLIINVNIIQQLMNVLCD